MSDERAPGGVKDVTGGGRVGRAVAELFQPFSPAYVEDPARAFYLPAHAAAPVAYSEAFSAWLITGHAEVTQVLRDPALFSSARNMDPMLPPPPEVVDELRRGVFPLPPSLFNNDPPGHTRARALFSKAFTPARVAALEPAVREATQQFIGALARRGGEVDLMQEIAFPLPLQISSRLVGIPLEDAPRLKAWQDDWFRILDPALDLEQKIRGARGFAAYHRYYLDLIERRRVAPADDLVTALIRARHEGEQPLSVEEMVAHLIILFFAGYETVASLTGSVVSRLLADPALWAAASDDPALLTAAVEETLRLDSPVQMEPRHTTAKAVVGGVEIPADEKLFVFFGAANHDAKVHPDPLRFDLRRPAPIRHLGFGWGVHTCIGATLARVEVKTAVQALRAAFPRMRLARDARPIYQPSLMFRTPAAVPVILDAG